MLKQNLGSADPKARLVLNEGDMHDFARGAAFLGTGGGGDPYIGRLMAQNAIREFGHPSIIDICELEDDATVCIVAMLGAPTVLMEKACSGADIELAIERMSQRLGKPIDAILPAEIGGVNSTIPIVAAARLGLPLLNADGMGRAFPEVQMVTMTFAGLPASPFVIVDEHLNSTIVEADSNKRTEDFVRAMAVQMGLSCLVTGYPMTGAEAKRATIHNTMTEALNIGRAIKDGRSTGNPVGAVLDHISKSDTYGIAKEIFDGKIVDIRRETEGGFSIGFCDLESFSSPGRKMEIQFQNECLIALEDGELRAIVPDLIVIVDRETGEPITVETLRYGQRVKVLAIGAPEALQTPAALNYVSPRCFGLEYEFAPLASLIPPNPNL